MAGFTIGEERFEIPPFDSFTLHECRLLYRMTGEDGDPIIQEQFEAADPDWPEDRRREHVSANIQRIGRPDFKIALAAIAYLRAHPDVSLENAQTLASAANGLEVTVAIILGGDDADPTLQSSNPSQTPLDGESSSSGPEKTADSGTSSAGSGTAPGTIHAITGTTGSDTSSRGVPPIASAS